MGGSGGNDGNTLKDVLDGLTKQTDDIEELLDMDGEAGNEVMEVPVQFVERQGPVDVFQVGDKQMVSVDQVLGLLERLNRSMSEPLEGVDVDKEVQEAEEFAEWANNVEPLGKSD